MPQYRNNANLQVGSKPVTIGGTVWTCTDINIADDGAMTAIDSTDSVGNAKDFAGVLEYIDGTVTLTRDQTTAAPAAGAEFNHPETEAALVIMSVNRNLSAGSVSTYEMNVRRKDYEAGS